MNLKAKTFKGLFWNGFDSVALNFIRFGTTVILSRILEPGHFGLIAVLSIFIALSETIMSGGFVTALIRKSEVRNEDYSTVFIFNFVISLFLYAIIFSFSPFIAFYFKEPQLNLIAKIIPLVIVFHSFSLVQQITLRRAINFKAISIANISSTTISSFLAIIMAVMGYGVWSLVAQNVLKALLFSMFLWITGTWKLSFSFSKLSFLENYNFGYKIMLSNIINSVFTNAYNIVIGRFYNTESLGFFYQARRINQFAHSIISKTFREVSLPILSGVQSEEEKLTKIYLVFMRSAAFLSFPLMFLLFVVADPLFNIVFTAKWAESIPLFKLFCVEGLVMPLIVITGNIPLVKGRADLVLKLEIIYKIQLIVALSITLFFGIYIMVVGIAIQITIQLIINIFIVGKLLNITFWHQILGMKKIAMVSLIATIFANSLGLFNFNLILLLSLQIFSFLFLYIGINYFTNSNEIGEIMQFVKRNVVFKKEL